ncbi:ATP-binding protein [Streptomyces sp. NPDC086082]|uniref:ATP-binding protein n=1 Tax=Streptomyces sp. NPDC086082 TaxID=3365750 RepID=UPI0038183F46
MSFEHWSVRISDANGAICGAGAYIGRDLVLTCAHVVGGPVVTGARTPPDGPMFVEFLGTASPNPIMATVAEDGWWPPGSDRAGDACVLRLTFSAPADAEPAPLGVAWEPGHTARAYGYPRNRTLEAGVHASATVTGLTMRTGWIQLNDLSSAGEQIQPGFSGGGAYNEQTGQIFGIVVQAYPTQRMSWLLPVELIAERIPLVREALGRAPVPRPRTTETELDALGAGCELPPDLRDFTGRESETAALIEQIEEDGPGPSIHSIAGMGGLGKTRLAVHLTHRLAANYPDGQYLLDLRAHAAGSESEPLTTEEALLALLRATVGKPPSVDGTERWGRIWRDVLRRRRMAVVLDNVASYEQIEELLPTHPGSLVLITSRRRLDELGIEGAVPITLKEFDEGSSVGLFTTIVGERRFASDPQAARDIVRLCGHLPLAIRLQASLTRGKKRKYSLAEIRDEMRKEADRLRGLQVGNISIRAAFSTSYRHLNVREQEMFRRLSLHPPGTMSLPAASALVDDPTTAEDTLDVLITESLVEDEGGHRLKTHDLLREYARECLILDEPVRTKHQALAARLLDFYLASALAAQRTLLPARPVEDSPDLTHPRLPDVSDRKSALTWFQTERDNLLRCCDLAEEYGQLSYLWRIPRAMGHFLGLASETDVAIEWYRSGLAASRGLDERGAADMNALLGEAYRVAGQRFSALDAFRAAREFYERTNDRKSVGDMLIRISAVQHGLGDSDGAQASCERALAHFAALGDEFGQAEAEYTLAMSLRMHGDHDPALGHLDRANSLFESVNYPLGQARCLNLTGVIHRLKGDYDRAIPTLRRAEGLYKTAGDVRGLAHAINNRASALGLAGRLDEAVAIHGEALDLLHRTHSFAYPDALMVAADLHGKQGDHAAAERQLREALGYYKPAEALFGQARAHLLLSGALRGQGHPARGLVQARESLALYASLGNENGMAAARAVEAECLAALNDDPNGPGTGSSP